MSSKGEQRFRKRKQQLHPNKMDDRYRRDYKLTSRR